MEGLRDNRFYEEQVLNNGMDEANAKGILSALRKDRAAFLLNDILISLLYVLIAAAFIVFILRKKLSQLF